MTTSTSSFTLRDYPDLKLAVAFNADEEPVALAMELPHRFGEESGGDWMVRDCRHTRNVDILGYTAVQALELLNQIARMS